MKIAQMSAEEQNNVTYPNQDQTKRKLIILSSILLQLVQCQQIADKISLRMTLIIKMPRGKPLPLMTRKLLRKLWTSSSEGTVKNLVI